MSQAPRSLGRLLAVAGAPHVLAVQFLLSTVSHMSLLALTLLVIDVFGSPALAGIVVLANSAGALTGPLAGTLIDRFGRKRMAITDFVISVMAYGAIGLLAMADRLDATTLLVLALVAGVTSSLSTVAVRTALPAVVPPDLLDMATGMTFNMRAASRCFAPLVPGFLTAMGEPGLAICVCAVLYGLAAIVFLPISDRIVSNELYRGMCRDIADGVQVVFANAILRRTTLYTAVAFFGWSAFFTALAPMIQLELHESAAVVGIVMALFGVADVVAGLITAHRDTRGVEWRYLTAGSLVAAVGLVMCGVQSLPVIVIGAVLIGLAETPVDHVIHVLRQRSIEPQYLSRVIAVEHSISMVFSSLGMAFAGWVAESSPSTAFFIAATFVAAGGAIAIVSVRGERTLTFGDPGRTNAS